MWLSDKLVNYCSHIPWCMWLSHTLVHVALTYPGASSFQIPFCMWLSKALVHVALKYHFYTWLSNAVDWAQNTN